jgi:hypothetical protein
MIISEKQIMQLMDLVRALLSIDHTPYYIKEIVCELLDEIKNQQSEELKNIE